MTIWVVFQILLNIIFLAGGLLIWARLSRPAKDDPRMSKGLQLLQSKIAILEDLSDRTDTQFKQLTQLLEQKGREVRESILAAQEQIHQVDVSIQKSLDVSKIFQDKIPHKEIIERQNTIKYIQAARLAHQGLTSEEISKQIDIPKGELDFIVKVNRNKLMFSEELLPGWVQEALPHQPEEKKQTRDIGQIFESLQQVSYDDQNIKKIEDEFKEAVEKALPPPAIEQSFIATNEVTTVEKPALEPQFEVEDNSPIKALESDAKKWVEEVNPSQNIKQKTEAFVQNSTPAQYIKQGEKEYLVKPFKFKKIQKKDEDIDEFMKI